MGRWANKYVIGLTGNIAMGKSVVRKMLEHLGAYSIDADGLAHQTMLPGAPAYQPVLETFGKWLLDKEGKIDRSKLGAVAFAHPDALSRLEAITHPIVRQGIDTLITHAKQPVIVLEAIKLVEGELGDAVDSIWVVDASPELQLRRLMEKRGMNELEARKRISTQNPQREKLGRANVVITNNGTPQDIWVQVEREWNRLTQPKPAPTPAPAPVMAPLTPPTSTQAAVPVQTAPRAAQTAQTMQPVHPMQPAQPAPNVQPLPGTPRPSDTGPLPTAAPQPAQPVAPAVAAQTTSTPPRPKSETMPPLPSQPARTTQSSPAAAPGGATVDIRRGMPRNAEAIAHLINQTTGKTLTRMDILGEKSYLLAEVGGKIMGVVGFQVENLIARIDEFIIVPEAPIGVITQALIRAVEDRSRELQTEVGFIYLPLTAPQSMIQAFVESGYERTELEAIKVPAWREAAAESQPPNTQILQKKLRADRVLKPL